MSILTWTILLYFLRSSYFYCAIGRQGKRRTTHTVYNRVEFFEYYWNRTTGLEPHIHFTVNKQKYIDYVLGKLRNVNHTKINVDNCSTNNVTRSFTRAQQMLPCYMHLSFKSKFINYFIKLSVSRMPYKQANKWDAM